MAQENESWAVGDELPLLDEGVYDATVTRIEPAYSKLYDKEQLMIAFAIGEYELPRWVTKPDGAVRPRMVFFKIAEALLGAPLKDHGQFTRDDLIGRACQVVVKIETKDDGTTQNRIDSVLKPPTKASNAPELGADVPFEAPPAEDEDEFPDTAFWAAAKDHGLLTQADVHALWDIEHKAGAMKHETERRAKALKMTVPDCWRLQTKEIAQRISNKAEKEAIGIAE